MKAVMQEKHRYRVAARVMLLIMSIVFGRLCAQTLSLSSILDPNARLFFLETFGGNGRTCLTCHGLLTGTTSPDLARIRYFVNPRDPLFLQDGSDDGNGHGVTRMLSNATILITLPVPSSVTSVNNLPAKSVTFRRGIPSTNNTPALDPFLMVDGRWTNLPAQALDAINTHFQPTKTPSAQDLQGLAEFEVNGPFFNPLSLRTYARGGTPPTLPQGRTDSEKRGRLFFVDTSPVGSDGRAGACALCHSGPLLNQTNQYLSGVPAGSRFQNANVSELNEGGNPVYTFAVNTANGVMNVTSPDPGRAMITGNFLPGVNSDFNAFKIPILWGINETAPYFHDNSAKTLQDVVTHYVQFFTRRQPPVILSQQDQADIVAFMKLLN